MRLVANRLLPRVLAGICAVGAGAAFIGLGGVGQADPQATAEQRTLTTSNSRPNAGQVIGKHGDSQYDYAPTIIKEGNKYRMWWCSAETGVGPAGDDIYYAESTNLNGPFSAPKAVLTASGGQNWDGMHTCDPSVVKVGSTYYMYYGGSNEAIGGGITSAGVASSPDGINWTRLNSGKPIITPAKEVAHAPYGAGQPSVVYKDGKFYLIFTDTTGKGSLSSNGAGQFAWRSADPTFTTGTEVFTAQGWKARTTDNSRSYSVANAFSADWQYSDELNSFIIAHNNDAAHTSLTFLSADDLRVQPYKQVTVAGPWADGPGIVSTPEKHALSAGPCGSVAVDLTMATVGGPPKVMKHKGVDIRDPQACPTTSPTATPTTTPTTSPTATPTQTPTATVPPTGTPSKTPIVSAAPGKAGDGGKLPKTGSPVLVIAGAGTALLAGGALLYVLSRRRNVHTAA